MRTASWHGSIPKSAGGRAPHPLVFLALFFAALALPACGGGGGTADPGATVPPSNLVYDDGNPLYRTDAPITPNSPTVDGGAVTLYTCTPALPAGLSIDPSTGVISGTPLAPSAAAPHTVEASNAGGSTQSVVVIEVKWALFKSIEPQQGLSDADIRYFLDRTHFGFNDAKYADINVKGMSTYLDDELAAIGPTPALEAEAEGFVEDTDFPSFTELALYWLHMLQRTPNPLQESIALHWHDHFACSSDVLSEASTYWFFDHINLWRHNGAGNLRDLILAMARDWSMLEYLDGRDSTAAAPNENFGREYLELYCNGADEGYDQADIVAAAALFSGYRRVFNPGTQQFDIVWNPNFHNANDQTFLGVFFPGVSSQPQDEYAQVVDVTLAHKPQGDTIGYTSRWIVKQILRRYCMENPDQVLIDQLATVLENANWELTPLFKTLFLSEAFYSSQAKAGFVKTPTEHMLGFIHSTGLVVQIQRGNLGFGDGGQLGLDNVLANLSNRMTQPPVVAGWPEGTSWFSAQGMVDRANALEFIIGEQRGFQANEGVDLTTLLTNGTTSTTTQTVDDIELRFGITLTPSEQTRLEEYLDTDEVGSLTNDPWDASNPTHIDERLRGLLYVMGQHPQYLLR